MTPRKAAPDYGDVESQLRSIERKDDEGELDLGRGARLHVSSLSKPYFPDAGITKGCDPGVAYGSDGTALWLTLMTPGASDVHVACGVRSCVV